MPGFESATYRGGVGRRGVELGVNCTSECHAADLCVGGPAASNHGLPVFDRKKICCGDNGSVEVMIFSGPLPRSSWSLIAAVDYFSGLARCG